VPSKYHAINFVVNLRDVCDYLVFSVYGHPPNFPTQTSGNKGDVYDFMLFFESFYFLQENFNVWIGEKHRIIDVPFFPCHVLEHQKQEKMM
jgi:hypothetical protein